jgi:N6-adenosine-specific RNA methylase IME4
MKLDIARIQVGQRKRKLDEGKVRSLAESFESIGQLQPITVEQCEYGNYRMIAGLHRLEAAKLLGWESIEAQEFEGDAVAAELAEIDENLMRNDLTVLEQGEHLARRNEILEIMGGRRGVGRYSNGETVSPLKTTSEIAKESGLSERSAQQRMQVARNIVPEVKDAIRDTEIANSTTQLLELARLAPEKQVEVAKGIAEGASSIAEFIKSIDGQKREARRIERIDKINAAVENNKPLNGIGVFPVIYADPPWEYDFPISDSRRIENQYPTMSLDVIMSLPVNDIAADDAILFLWATTPFLRKGLLVMQAWGFDYRTSMVWVKPSIGPGQWVRQRHEYLLIGVRGDIPTPKGEDKPDSVIEAPREEHSKKPEIVYDIIERMYPELPKVELFSRRKRENWAAWGNEI